MIGRLRGELVIKQPPDMMLDVGGVGYELQAPMSTFYVLPEIGEQVTVFTHLQVRDDAHVLFGFINENERRMFRALLRITGVGAKMALAVLSGMDAQTFGRCIQQGDTASLVRLPGIGRKTAERLIVEMRDRLDTLMTGAVTDPNHSAVVSQNPVMDPLEDAIQALVALGYKPQEASRMVRKIDTTDVSREEIIRLALKTSLK
ncbi:MAG: Holliday junction branch migration protein RuvA [Gammaproteobacteria bacterium]|nr:Holliday junction branch migration protein RuvA [Gammaproteobacteria bacterium]